MVRDAVLCLLGCIIIEITHQPVGIRLHLARGGRRGWKGMRGGWEARGVGYR